MSEPEIGWDDVVDVICIGSGSGLAAYAAICAAAEFEVLHLDAPADFDSQTAGFLAAMTEDLPGWPVEETDPPTVLTPAPLRRDTRGRPDVLDPFVGEHIRQWSARCAVSPSAVIFTHVPTVLDRMRTESGEIVTAAAIDGSPDTPRTSGVFAGLLWEDAALAGAAVQGPRGPRRVRAEAGLAFDTGPAPRVRPRGANALVSRPYARFARLESVEIRDA